jgi:methylated-DNA-protein-cysteine methyltransferase related protein
MEPSFFERVYRVVQQIPRGKVASYGQIAALLGHPQAARTVGWALNALTSERAAQVPWQRVINSAGRISISRADLSADIQRALLEDEGIEFDEREHVDMRRFGWAGMDWDEVEALWLPRENMMCENVRWLSHTSRITHDLRKSNI